MKRIQDIATFMTDGDWIESDNQSKSGIRLIQTGNIGTGKYLNKEARAKFISEETFENLKCTEIFPGDILVSRLPDPVGRACILPEGLGRTITAVDCTILRLNEDLCNRRYLVYYTQSPYYAVQVQGFLAGSTRIRISRKNLEKIEIPLHDKAFQMHVIETFSSMDAAIENRQRVLTLLDELVKSRFVEMFGDPVLNPKKWERHQLNDDIIFLTSGSRGWSKYFSRDGEIFITIKNVKNGRITLDDVQYVHAPDNAEAKRTKVQAGDLLISITADLGRTGVVSEALAKRGAYINQHLTCIRLNRNVINPEYTAMFMESVGGKCQFDAKNQVGVKAGLNFEAIKGLEIMVPPLSLQNQFSTFVHQVEATKTSVRTQLTALTTLRAKMMQEFFG